MFEQKLLDKQAPFLTNTKTNTKTISTKTISINWNTLFVVSVPGFFTMLRVLCCIRCQSVYRLTLPGSSCSKWDTECIEDELDLLSNTVFTHRNAPSACKACCLLSEPTENSREKCASDSTSACTTWSLLKAYEWNYIQTFFSSTGKVL